MITKSLLAPGLALLLVGGGPVRHTQSTQPPLTRRAILPRDSVNTDLVPSTGRRLTVRAGGNLQRALNSAERGDQIVLAAGAKFVGTFTLPAKRGTTADGWITITTDATEFPSPGTRAGPEHAALMPKIITRSSQAALQTEPRASGWRIIGVEITVVPDLKQVQNGLVLLGDGSEAQHALADVPSDLILDRVYVHGAFPTETKRCVALNSARSAVINSYLADCAGKGYDTQAILGWNGPGPYLIENNRLEGAGENIMFGGADPKIANLVPSDITIRRNYIHKPQSWLNKWTVKNLFELKNAQRVLIEGNVLRNNWANGQSGYAVVLGSVNQDKGCSWCIVQDVTFRQNHIDSTAGGFLLFEGYQQAQWMRRVNISYNLITNVGILQQTWGGNGRMFFISGHVDDIAIENNTGFSTLGYLQFGDETAVPKQRFTFRNNVGGNAQYNLQSPLANGAAMFTTYCGTQYLYEGNVIVMTGGGKPDGNSYPRTVAEVGLIADGPERGAMRSSSPFRRSGMNGLPPGVNPRHLAKLAEVAR